MERNELGGVPNGQTKRSGSLLVADPLRSIEAAVVSRRWASIAIIAVALGAGVAAGIGSVGIWSVREGRVAACVADIVKHGRWMVPELWGRPRLEKPAIPYWFSASIALVAGRLDEWTLRAPGLLLAALLVAVAYRFGYEAAGRRAGLLAALFVLSSLFCTIELRKQSSDIYLAAFTAAALACWWQGYRRAERRWPSWPAAGLFLGLAMLSKGPVVLAVLAPPMLATLLIDRRLTLRASRHAWLALAIPVVMVAAWAVAVLRQEPEAWAIWIYQLDLKVAEGDASSTRGPLFYLLQWPSYLFPWVVFGLGAVLYGLRRRVAVPAVVRLCWWWFFGNLALFSLFQCRKSYYLLPAITGLAVLASYAAVVADRSLRSRYRNVFRLWAVHLQFATLTITWVVFTAIAWSYRARFGLMPLAASLVLTGMFVYLHLLYWRTGRLVGGCIAGALLFSAAIGSTHLWLLNSLDADHSARQFAERIRRLVPAGETILFWGEPDPSLWMYLDRELERVESLAAAKSGEVRFLLVPAESERRALGVMAGPVVLARSRRTVPTLLAALSPTAIARARHAGTAPAHAAISGSKAGRVKHGKGHAGDTHSHSPVSAHDHAHIAKAPHSQAN